MEAALWEDYGIWVEFYYDGLQVIFCFWCLLCKRSPAKLQQFRAVWLCCSVAEILDLDFRSGVICSDIASVATRGLPRVEKQVSVFERILVLCCILNYV